jgi:hypothetical protein
MEDFKSDLDALRIKRAAFEEQLRKGEGDARSLQDQLRQIDAQRCERRGVARRVGSVNASARPGLSRTDQSLEIYPATAKMNHSGRSSVRPKAARAE